MFVKVKNVMLVIKIIVIIIAMPNSLYVKGLQGIMGVVCKMP